MCGINLILSQHEIPEQAIASMNNALRHRGPDAMGVKTFLKGRGMMGHTRLRIVGLSAEADQPFLGEDGEDALVFNGEIYNYQALRKELEDRGERFRTNSDTEVLFKLLVREGAQAIDRLEGMFAFAFWDGKDVLLARDSSGMKPLYYFDDGQTLVVSSELRGIFASGLVSKKLNEAQLGNYLHYKHVKKPNTFFKDVWELPEGTFLKRGRELTTASIPQKWDVNPSRVNTSASLEELLISSVERHLLADVPVGLFLSGGVDSTLLLAITRELGYNQMEAFAVANTAEESSFGTLDFHYADRASKQYGVKLNPLEVDVDILDRFDELVDGIDQPVADGASLLTFLLSEKAGQGFKAVLSGAGADELFGGYNRHQAFAFYQKHFLHHPFKISAFKQCTKWLPDGLAHPFRKQFRLLKKLGRDLAVSEQQTWGNFVGLDTDLLLDKSDLHWELPSKTGLEYDQSEYLISDILAITDKLSMQHGLEVRLPFLDRDLVKFAKGLSWGELMRNGPKWLLKEMLNQRGGMAYSNRKKEGFGMPLGQWLRIKKGKLLLERLLAPQSLLFNYVNLEAVMELKAKHLKGFRDFSQELWALMVLSAWLEKEFSVHV